MSDRMPEDLPVRKCINVMVGITRSKVIIFHISSFSSHACLVFGQQFIHSSSVLLDEIQDVELK